MCSSYKGVLPSDLIEKYSGVGGWRKLEFDIATLGEIHDQITDATKKGSDFDGSKMEARKRQRRSKRADLTGGDLHDILKKGGFTTNKEGEP